MCLFWHNTSCSFCFTSLSIRSEPFVPTANDVLFWWFSFHGLVFSHNLFTCDRKGNCGSLLIPSVLITCDVSIKVSLLWLMLPLGPNTEWVVSLIIQVIRPWYVQYFSKEHISDKINVSRKCIHIALYTKCDMNQRSIFLVSNGIVVH